MPQNPACDLCELHQFAENICIWGEWRGPQPGYSDPRVMLVGQNPGWNENLQNRVFIGESGQWVDEGMRVGGVKSFYITNAVKCFWDKEPKTSEVKACAPYLEEEIAQVKPTHILALGAVAMRRLLGPGKITELQGKEQWSEKYGCWIMPILHPANIMRSGGDKRNWIADVARFGELTRGTLAKQPPVTVEIVKTPEELGAFTFDLLSNRKPFTFDYESKPGPDDLGLKWWHRDFQSYSLAFSFEGRHAVVVPTHHPESPFDDWDIEHFYHAIRPVMTNPGVLKTPHNMLYDDLVFWREAGYQPYTNIDTAPLTHLLDENRSKRLKWLGRVLLGWPDWDVDATKEHPLDELGYYNGCDAAATWQLAWAKFLPELATMPELFRYFARLVMPYMRALERMIYRGIHVNEELIYARIAECERRIMAADMKIPVENPASSVQVARWFYDELKLPVHKFTEGGKPSTDEETINWLALQGFAQAKDVLDCRRPRKQKGTYFEPALKDVESSIDRRRHMNVNAATVETGRLSGGFHTTPRDTFVRNMYDAPPGWTLVQADGQQIEARFAAWWAAGKPATWADVVPQFASLLLAFKEGRDPYLEMAAAALRKPSTEVTREGGDNERQVMGKVPTLAMIYDISWKGFQEYAWSEFEIIYTDAEAQHLHRTFYNLWPEIKRWHEREKKLLAAKGWTQAPLGRVRRLPAVFGSDKKVVAEALRSGINAPVQGTASDVTQAALILAEQLFDQDRAFVVGDIHDALLFQVHDSYLEEFLTIIPHLFPETIKKLAPLGLLVPDGLIKSEITIGPWGSKMTDQDYWAQQRALRPALDTVPVPG